MKLENVRRDDWILAGLALLLVLDLLFLDWFTFGNVVLGSTTLHVNFTAVDAPDGWLGVLAVIAGILLVLDVLIEQVSPQTAVPAIGGSRTATRLVLALATGLFMALKFLFHLGHFSNLGLGFWIGAVLAIALIYFAFRSRTATLAAPRRTTGAAPSA